MSKFTDTHTLETALSLFSCWWAMIEAEREITDQSRIEDDAVVLMFSGSGASCQVYAKDIRLIAEMYRPPAEFEAQPPPDAPEWP